MSWLPKIRTIWEHKKTSGRYVVTGHCQIEATWSPGVLYVHLGGPQSEMELPICRPLDEFMDGRFRELNPALGK